MALVGKVGRRSPRARFAMFALYLVLTLGAVTTLYPFLLMVSTGFKGASDQNDDKLVPQYWSVLDVRGLNGKLMPESLYGKYLLDKYSGNQSMVDSTRVGADASQGEIRSYEEFLGTLPVDDYEVGFRTPVGQVTGRLAVLYQGWLRSRYGTIDRLNRAYIDENTGFQTVAPPNELLERRDWKPPNDLKYEEWLEFKAGLPAEFRIPLRAQRMFQEFLRSKFQNQFDKVPKEAAGSARRFEEVLLPTSGPLLSEFRQNWLPSRFLPPGRSSKYLSAQGSTLLSRQSRERRPKPIPSPPREGRFARPHLVLNPADLKLGRFLSLREIPVALSPSGGEGGFRSIAREAQFFLKADPTGQSLVVHDLHSGTVEDLWAQRSSSPMPIAAYEHYWVVSHSGQIRREFAGRNYRFVLDYVAINGRALWNTVIFCGLAILLQLLVNPLAAYALARYPIRASGKILLFLLATMAFPAEVAMIPSFLLLKQLGLLNTFAALVLPTAASGYMIFLLKGFFDSLPPELYEAGQLDGARETTMMFRIALPLSKPVLGYLALMAFMGAYGAFIYAFLVAQDQRVWTLMVWIYNLQTYAPKAVIMAALAMAALPTLLVFLFAQRVIMRGIILPGER